MCIFSKEEDVTYWKKKKIVDFIIFDKVIITAISLSSRSLQRPLVSGFRSLIVVCLHVMKLGSHSHLSFLVLNIHFWAFLLFKSFPFFSFHLTTCVLLLCLSPWLLVVKQTGSLWKPTPGLLTMFLLCSFRWQKLCFWPPVSKKTKTFFSLLSYLFFAFSFSYWPLFYLLSLKPHQGFQCSGGITSVENTS